MDEYANAFVIIDAKNLSLHLVRANPSLVVSLTERDLDEVAETLGATNMRRPGLQGLPSLLWAALVLSSGAPSDEALARLQQEVGRLPDDVYCIALRYLGPDPATLVAMRRTR